MIQTHTNRERARRERERERERERVERKGIVEKMVLYMLRSLAFATTGYYNFTRDGYIRASKSFEPNALDVDMSGRTVVVTGANTGIGFATAQALAKRRASVHLVCRNEKRGTDAVEKVRAAQPDAHVTLHTCDLSSLESVRAFATEWKDTKRGPVHVLVNNAGCMVHDREKRSAEGYDINFATNTLGTFVFTRLMEPSLRDASGARVITVSSGGMLTEPLLIDDLQGETLRPYDAVRQYARDKRRQVALTELWASREARRDAETAATSSGTDNEQKTKDAASTNNMSGRIEYYSMHPGWSETDGLSVALPTMTKRMGGKGGNLRDWDMAADTIVWLAVVRTDGDSDVVLHPGEFYLDREPARKVTPLDFGVGKYSLKQVELLEEKLESMAGLPSARA